MATISDYLIDFWYTEQMMKTKKSSADILLIISKTLKKPLATKIGESEISSRLTNRK